MRRLSRRVRSHPPNAPHAIYEPLIPLTLYLSPPSMRLLSHNTSSPAARHTASSRNPAAIPHHPITTPKRRILSSPPPLPHPQPPTRTTSPDPHDCLLHPATVSAHPASIPLPPAYLHHPCSPSQPRRSTPYTMLNDLSVSNAESVGRWA